MSGFYIIVDMGRARAMNAGRGLPSHGWLPERVRPSFVHLERAAAEDELIRLQKAHGGEFVLFESVARCEGYLIKSGVYQVVDDK